MVTCDLDDPVVVPDLVLRPAGEVGQLPVAQLPDHQLVQPTSLPAQVYKYIVKVYRCKEKVNCTLHRCKGVLYLV